MLLILIPILFSQGCGEDPVLKAAREQAGASGAPQAADASSDKGGDGGTTPASSGGRGHPIDGGRGHPIDGGNPSGGTPGDPEPVKPGDPEPGVPADPEAVAMGPGIPEEPEPGDPEEPPPAGGMRAPPPIQGPTVTVTGYVDLPDYTQGTIRIDVYDGDHLAFGGPRPGVVTMVTLDGPGEFSIEVPESSKYVWLSAFNDEDQNGRPGPVDPTGHYEANPVDVSDGDVDGVEITLERRDPPGANGGDPNLEGL
jgi:hypothetical protein